MGDRIEIEARGCSCGCLTCPTFILFVVLIVSLVALLGHRLVA